MFAVAAAIVVSLLAGCDLAQPLPVSPDYNMSYVEWSAVPRVDASADASAAALGVLALSADREIRAFGESGSVENTGGLGVSLMPHYRPGSLATGRAVYDSLVPTGIIDVRLFRRLPRVWLRSFLIKRSSSGWLYVPNGLGNWWEWDMEGLSKVTTDSATYRYVHVINRLGWYVVRTQGRDFAYPSAHMGEVLFAPRWTGPWTLPDPGAYPPEVVYDLVR